MDNVVLTKSKVTLAKDTAVLKLLIIVVHYSHLYCKHGQNMVYNTKNSKCSRSIDLLDLCSTGEQ